MSSHTKVTMGAITIASLALVCLAVGCGKSERSSRATASASENALPASTGAQVMNDPAVSQAIPTGEDVATVTGDSLPPEVSASIADTLVVPGSIIDITAEGSPEVVEVTLADGIGKRQKFAFDAGSNLWHVSYRVPLRFPSERLGLSVTAKDANGRWRRVWVFLSVPKPETQEPAVTEK